MPPSTHSIRGTCTSSRAATQLTANRIAHLPLQKGVARPRASVRSVSRSRGRRRLAGDDLQRAGRAARKGKAAPQLPSGGCPQSKLQRASSWGAAWWYAKDTYVGALDAVRAERPPRQRHLSAPVCTFRRLAQDSHVRPATLRLRAPPTYMIRSPAAHTRAPVSWLAAREQTPRLLNPPHTPCRPEACRACRVQTARPRRFFHCPGQILWPCFLIHGRVKGTRLCITSRTIGRQIAATHSCQVADQRPATCTCRVSQKTQPSNG